MASFTFPEVTKEGAKKVLIISSHPNVGKSTSHRLIRAAKETLESEGCAVIVEDLIAIGFNPVGGPHDFIDVHDPDFFDYQGEQKRAAQEHKFAPDVQHQMDLLDWCDVVIHQYPIYWWGLPAIHKGWLDRVLAYYYCYGGTTHTHLRGKKWMCSVTTGAPTNVALMGVVPTPGYPSYTEMSISFAQATPVFCGMETLPMFVIGGTLGRKSEEERQVGVNEYINHLRVYVTGSLETLPSPSMSASVDLTNDAMRAGRELGMRCIP
jgi:NAD(P)H dehydrogenase (quinone)